MLLFINTIIVIIIEFWYFLWLLLCYTLVSVLVLGIGIAEGQYYWVLDIGCLSWYRSNPIKYIGLSSQLSLPAGLNEVCEILNICDVLKKVLCLIPENTSVIFAQLYSSLV